MVRDRTLYNRLEIEPNATEPEIKKAYNRLSKIWHPDKNIENKDEANKKFLEITEAKDILLDSNKRSQYDSIGMDFINSQNGPQFNQFGFADIFGSGFPFNFNNFNSQRNENNIRIEDLIEHINCPLEYIYNNRDINLTYKYKSTCVDCNGNGGFDSTCKECEGKGMKLQVIRIGPMIQQMFSTCNICNGSGIYINENNKCKKCNGNTFNYIENRVDFKLNSKIIIDNKIIFTHKGHHIKNQKSNLIINVNIIEDNLFKFKSNSNNYLNLYIDIQLNLYEALFGFNKSISHLDGRNINLTYNGKTDFNTVRKLKNEGLKDSNNKSGDLYIKFKFILPDINTNNKNYLKTLLFDSNYVINDDIKESNLESTLDNE